MRSECPVMSSISLLVDLGTSPCGPGLLRLTHTPPPKGLKFVEVAKSLSQTQAVELLVGDANFLRIGAWRGLGTLLIASSASCGGHSTSSESAYGALNTGTVSRWDAE